MRSFKLENIEHACYFAVGVWLSNFCHGFRNTSSSKIQSRYK